MSTHETSSIPHELKLLLFRHLLGLGIRTELEQPQVRLRRRCTGQCIRGNSEGSESESELHNASKGAEQAVFF